MTRREFMAISAAAGLSPHRLSAVTDIHHILSTGQSLSFGNGFRLTTSQPSGQTNKTMDATYQLGTNIVDLTANNAGEVPDFGWCAQLTTMAGAYQIISTKHGLGATNYDGLKRIPASPGSPITGTTQYQYGQTQLANVRAAAITAGLNSIVVAVDCIHGEANKTDSAATYAGYLVQWQKDYQWDVQQVTGQTGTHPFFTDQVHSTASQDGNIGPTLGQWQAARQNVGKIFLVCPKYMLTYADGLHNDNYGARLLGEYHGKAMYQVLVLKRGWIPLCPRSINRVGAVIYCRFWVPVLPLVIDISQPNMGDKGPGKGFEYFDDSGATPAISSVSVSGDMATITLASTPTGVVESLAVAYTGSGALDSTTRQMSNIRDSDSVVGALSNKPLYNWATTFRETLPFSFEPYPQPLSAGGLIGGGGAVVR